MHRERVRFGDLDAMRHLNNVVFLRYFETARIAFLRRAHPAHDPSNAEADPYGVIFAECHISYRSPVHFDEDSTCAARSARCAARRSRCCSRCTSESVSRRRDTAWLVGYDYGAQKSAPLPDDLRSALTA